MVDRNVEAGELARALGISPDSVGRYAREGRIPFAVTPGGHRRYDIDEVRLALGVAGETPSSGVFSVPSATLRARAIRSVTTPRSEAVPAKTPAVVVGSDAAADELLSSAWRVQRSVPIVTA